MAGLVRPKAYPIRDPKSDAQTNGVVFNPYRYSKHGGLSSASKLRGDDNPFNVEAPAGGKSPATESDRSLSE